MKKRLALFLALVMVLSSGMVALGDSGFTDIKDHWAEKEIMALSDLEILRGYADMTYRPEKKLTRAEFVAIINRTLGLSKEAPVNFSDVKTGDWFYKDLALAMDKGYIKGYPDGTFQAKRFISREEAVTVIVRAFDLKGMDKEAPVFKDQAKVKAYAQEPLKIVSAEGYIGGYPDGEFKPQNFISRAEVAKIISKLMEKDQADVIYINGNIYTVNENFDKVEAMAVKNGRFIYVGEEEEARAFTGPKTEIVDLEGQTVLPGLIDSHLHFSGVGSKLQQIDAFWAPKEDILASVKEAAQNAQPGDWIVGRGWNQEVWDPAIFPSKTELDAVAPDNPVVLTRVCGHAIWVNSKALEESAIDATGPTPNPVGGEIIRKNEEDDLAGRYPDIQVGEPIGVMVDTAAGLVTKNKAPDSESKLAEAIQLANDHILSYGITSVRDAGQSREGFERLKAAYEKGKVDLRIYMMASQKDADEFYKIPEADRVGLYDNKLSVRSIKLMADGSLGARSAWMLEPYSDREGHYGDRRYTDEELYQLVSGAAKHGFQVNTHAIGDAANRQVLDAYEKVFKELGSKDYRFAIEHAQILAPEDIPRFKELGVIPSMQFVHATSDLNMAEDRMGPERIKGAYAWRTLLDTGVIIPNGTDAQVELVNPFHGLYAGVTRQTREGKPDGGWYPEQKLTREEALRAYTIWGAYAQFQEDWIGSIEKGKFADFTIIDRDYLSIPESEIKDIEALATFVAGERVYQSDKLATVEE
ncbi:MAG: amidohydrolase family protein [Tissierellia bacterium]|nr:amidohydrolase family protein [Tissierellia bacterium]